METAVLNGLVGGLVATVVMTVAMRAAGGDDLPTAVLWAKYAGTDAPDAYLPQGMVLHLLYGIGAGAAFAVVLELGGLLAAGVPVVTALGLGYGVLLFGGGAVFWMKIVLAITPTRPLIGRFLLVHLIYGAGLGAWLAVGIPF